MGASVLLRGGGTLYRVETEGAPPTSIPLAADPFAAAELVGSGYADGLSEAVVRWARSAGNPVPCEEPALAVALNAAGVPTRSATFVEVRAALDFLPKPNPRERRVFRLAAAHAQVERALASDDETLVALAREESRLERAIGRELGAFEQFLAPPEGPLADHQRLWELHREVLAHHQTQLQDRLDAVARRVVPNLSEVVGPRIAARLVAAAGDRVALARMSASRLQLLGARRRPGAGRGPRFGVIFRAVRMEDVPLDRQGRYARSLAALAVIAARADAFTQARVSDRLVGRRDRRVATLRRRS